MKTSGLSGNFQNIILYSICTLIWGSTWFAITWQIDAASPIASVFWRFLLAFSILFVFCLVTKKNMTYRKQDHLLFAGQGIFMFSINYMLTYLAETMTTSGMVALSFTVLLYYNIFGMRIFFKKPLNAKVIMGALIGGLGVVSIFLNEILNFDPASRSMWGLVIGFIATLSASAGNLVAQKSYQLRIPVVITNTYGMMYGSLFTLVVGLALQVNFAIPMTAKFLGAMTYLALFGTVIAFGAYLSLAGRIGPEKAAYSGIISPVIALLISSFFENFHWTTSIVIGVIFCLFGNFLTLMPKKSRLIKTAGAPNKNLDLNFRLRDE